MFRCSRVTRLQGLLDHLSSGCKGTQVLNDSAREEMEDRKPGEAGCRRGNTDEEEEAHSDTERK